MNEFVEKLLDRLEEHCEKKCTGICSVCDFNKAISIVKEVAAEYNKKFIPATVYDQVRWERDIAIEQLHELGYEWGQKIDSNDGWIPVEERLPEEKGTYLVTVKHFGVAFSRFTGQKDNLHFDSNVIAWRKLPASYRPKGE